MPTVEFWRLLDKAIANQKKLGGYGKFCYISENEFTFRAYAQGVEAGLRAVESALKGSNLGILERFSKIEDWEEKQIQ